MRARAKDPEGGSSSATRKASGDDEGGNRPCKEGQLYRNSAIAAFQSVFPLIIRQKLANSNELYALTYFKIQGLEEVTGLAGRRDGDSGCRKGV